MRYFVQRLIRTILGIGNRALTTYVALASLAYLGIYLNNQVITTASLISLVTLTSYLLALDFLVSLTLDTLSARIIVEAPRVTMGSMVPLRLKLASRMPLRLRVLVKYVAPPHLFVEPNTAVINGPEARGWCVAKWCGLVNIVGVKVRFVDPLGMYSNVKFIRANAQLSIEPRPTAPHTGVPRGMGYINDSGPSPSRSGEFLSIVEYSPGDPASTIHWLTTAKVGQLMAVQRGEWGRPRVSVVLESTREMLRPLNGARRIDRALGIVAHLAKVGELVEVVLVGNGWVKVVRGSLGSLVEIERMVRLAVLSPRDLRRARRDLKMGKGELGDEELMEVAYVEDYGDSISWEKIEPALALPSGSTILLLISEATAKSIPGNFTKSTLAPRISLEVV